MIEIKTDLNRWGVWALTAALGLASGVWLFGRFTRITQAQAEGAIRNRTGKFLSLRYGRVETAWMVEAAQRVDMMLFSANVQVTVPQAVREANPKVICLGYLNTLDFDGRDGGRLLETPGI